MILLMTPDELITAKNMIFKRLRNSAGIIRCQENLLNYAATQLNTDTPKPKIHVSGKYQFLT